MTAVHPTPLRVIDFTPTPGPRARSEGPFSGEEFLQEFLEPRFLEARQAGTKLVVDLDGCQGFATSFLEAVFGGLARDHGAGAVLGTLEFKSDDEPLLIEEIKRYIADANNR